MFMFAVFHHRLERPSHKYIHMENDNDINAAGYLVGFPDDNPVNFNRFQVKNGEKLMTDPVDQMKLSLQVRIFGGYRVL